jgi:hypothetical protein
MEREYGGNNRSKEACATAIEVKTQMDNVSLKVGDFPWNPRQVQCQKHQLQE